MIVKCAAAILVFLFAADSALAADDLDFSKITCKQFIGGPKDEIGTILTWLEGYYTKENAPPIMYADKTVKDPKALSEYCDAHPDQDIIKAADEVMPVK